KYLEVCFFLGRTVTSPRIKRATPASRVKVAHLVQVRHRDEVEAPLTDWIREAYETSNALSGRAQVRTTKATARKNKSATKQTAKKKKVAKKKTPAKKSSRATSRGGVP